MQNAWGEAKVMERILLTAIPPALISGLVQEGTKLIPVASYWWHKRRQIDPKFGLIIGVVAGAGFGILEAQWVHSSAYFLGSISGNAGATVFVERFFIVAFHAGASGLAGWGLARGWGWQFYLIASVLHGAINYVAIFSQMQTLSILQVELVIAVISLTVTAYALLIRWKKEPQTRNRRSF
jgi:RsiW-degrading membrane proteinase PrsW (M82 family)